MSQFRISRKTENAFDAIHRAMDEMRALPGSTLVIESGDYVISSPLARQAQSDVMYGKYTKDPQPFMFSEKYVYDILFDFDGHKNTTVEAYGVRFIIDGFMENVSFRNCKGCTFRGGEFDHLRRPWSRGVIVSQAGNTVTAEFPSEYRFNDSSPHLRIFTVNPKNNEINANFYIKSVSCGENIANIELSGELPYSVGQYAYIWHTFHSRPCFLIYNSKNITVWDCTVRTHPGMGVTAQVSENITLKRFKVLPPEGEFISTNTDSIHISSCRGKLVIEDCMLVGMGDDGLNVHTYYADILSAEGDSAEIAIAPPDGTHAQLPCPPCIGDTVELVSKKNLEEKNSFKILSVEETGFNRYRLAVDKPLEGVDTNEHWLVNASAVPMTEVRNTVFKNHFARGVLIKCKRALIENCYFENIADSAVRVAPQSSWKEGVASEDVTVKGCKIVNCGWLEKLCGGIFVYNEAEVRDCAVHKNITVEGCSFENMPTENIVIKDTENPVIRR